jgi:hypothetical protein
LPKTENHSLHGRFLEEGAKGPIINIPLYRMRPDKLEARGNISILELQRHVADEMSQGSASPRTARVIGGLDSSDIFCNSDYKHFLA